MPSIRWNGRELPCEAGETVLDCLLRAGIPAASSCRTGACQTCIVRAARGRPTAASQRGLKETWRAQGLFLACQCVPTEDLDVGPADAFPEIKVTVRRVARLAPDVVRVSLEPEAPLDYRAGQFIHLVRGDGLARPFSLASVAGLDPLLELHVKRVPGGEMSGYLHERAREGDVMAARGPAGECFYVEGRPEQPLVLAGTGTGLAPLLGVARDALARGHRGPIVLHHGARTREGLYADAELRELARRHPTLEYAPCALEGGDGVERGEPVEVGRLDEIALRSIKARPGCRVFLCGAPDFVRSMRKAAFMAGVFLGEILADAFAPAAPRPS
ncbi:MAG: 2Fe-2S iron-sulfur cluster binding domain-containing protein [Polyangiaceae bacterium]|nr:2Fe-2S iron-sulfur cluster binding domain-containing protein [Polyangiaceae bacterium]